MVWLSEYQQHFITIMNGVGCLSTEQALYLMKKFLNISGPASNRFLDSLVTSNYISFSEDGKFIMNGSKRMNKNVRIDRDVIKAMNYILEAVDSLDVLKSIFRASNGQSVINFINNGNMYEVVAISSNDMYKATMAENKFKELQRSFEKKNVDAKTFSAITIFMFESTEDADDILEKMEMLKLEMPHIILIFKDSDITQKMEFLLFESI